MFSLLAFIYVFLLGCQHDRGNLKPPAKNEIRDVHGSLDNIARLDTFVKNVKNKIKDKVRLTQYTTEGDPIFNDLTYNGRKINLKFDSSNDQFGGGEVKSYSCKDIVKQESDTETKYLLEECPNTKELLTIYHDVDEQDYFAFELKYGVGLKNKINTKEQTLVKELQNGQTTEVRDFQFSKKELNQIYKSMVFANYLGEKKLTAKCSKNPYVSYELTVWINNGEEHFSWAECDKSRDGIEMTALVSNILAVLKNSPVFKSLPDLKSK